MKKDFTSYLESMPPFLTRDEKFCEISITAEDKRDTIVVKGKQTSPWLDGLSFNFYLHMPDLYGYLFSYASWQQNERIASTVRCRVVILLRKDPNEGDQIDQFKLVTVSNTDNEILVNVLAKRLTIVVSRPVGDKKICAIPNRAVNDNFHNAWYIIERVCKEPNI